MTKFPHFARRIFMKLSLLCCACLLVSSLHAVDTMVDEILAVVYHPEGNETILGSDLTNALDGQQKTFRDAVVEALMYIDAKRHKITVADEELDRFLAQIQQQNKWTQEELSLFLEQRGYNYEEGKDLLRRKQMINQIIDFRARSDKRMVVQKEEALAYYKKHPRSEDATYTLVVAFVPTTRHSRQEIDAMVKNKKLALDVTWDEPFVLKESELAKDRLFITKRHEDEIVLVDAVQDGVELTKLLKKTAKKEISFEDCFSDIAGDIRQERFAKVLQEYQESLLHDPATHIQYFAKGLKL